MKLNFFNHPTKIVMAKTIENSEIWVYGDAAENINANTPFVMYGYEGPTMKFRGAGEMKLPVINRDSDIEFVDCQYSEFYITSILDTDIQEKIEEFYNVNI